VEASVSSAVSWSASSSGVVTDGDAESCTEESAFAESVEFAVVAAGSLMVVLL